MFVTPTVREAPTTENDVFAFHIMGEVSAEDMEAMGAYMNEQFETHDNVSMLMIFDRFEGSETGASFQWETLKSRFRSLGKVDKYVVVGAPDGPSRMIEWMGKILPIEAKTFPREQTDEAWAFVGARPD
ncbi:STAS/SEC14 domain-containing protein [Palleronia sp. LCG004]|uniref:STAS/SEC14 domain-containing protein n=1 Tax=Palleronia sp. LCG004 TaxID=3079304 RepID=UPI002943143E|nr:STAS/SEC14 domain-containing protein [Palleronia sp. LCG004]WOI57090.1 STAS/SEC14 domain-containing protein [Palleronia sp. LCG004]